MSKRKDVMKAPYTICPHCGHSDLDPRIILVGLLGQQTGALHYQEVTTLKCQSCGWLGEQDDIRRQA